MVENGKQSTGRSKLREPIPDNWVESCRPRMLAYGRSKVPLEVAEDLTQDTLLTAMQKLSTFRGCGKFEHWLLAIFRRKMLDYWRDKKRSHTNCDGYLEILSVTKATSRKSEHAGEPHKLLELAELGSVIEQALAQLPKNQKQVICLSRDSDLSANEIAKLLNLSVPNVWVSLHRARKRLRERVDQYAMS
jgi:RNA polymerase sigma-70 factor (ECF subfamily)